MALLRERTLVRQHQIIEAVRNLIATKGMESVTIGSIAEAVGLTEGAIYRHFSSKQQILCLLIDEMEKALLDRVTQAQVSGGTAPETLRRILEAHLSGTEGFRAVSFIIIAEAMAFDGIGLQPRVSAMLTRYLDRIRQVLRRGVEEGTLRPDLDIGGAATIFFGLIQSTATLWALHEYAPPLAEHRDQMWDIFTNGILAAP